MWLLEENKRRELQAAAASFAPTVEQRTEFEARAGGDGSLLTVVGSVAEIAVSGVLTQKPDFFASLFGGGNTTYEAINAALASAEADPAVTGITLAIDSPGGQFAGLFDTLAALQNVTKPLKAVIYNVGASAAYAIASQAGEIVAANRASRIGSVGVAASLYVSENRVDIASTNAPKKRPDAKTAEGRAVIREELDALHDIFVDAIASGRKITAQAVNADFGRGATLLAEDAKSRGMIDAVLGSVTETGADSGGVQTEEKMDLKTLKAENSELYAEAVQIGVAQERDRVTAHLIMGEKSGAMETAVGAVRDGSDMTATLTAEYMTAGMNRSDVDARQADDDDATAGDGATASDDTGGGASVADIIEAKLGLEV